MATGNDPGAPAPQLSEQEKEWAMYCHMSALAGMLILVTCVGPLVCWLAKRETSPFYDYHGKEALNFQINIDIYALATFIMALILGQWMLVVPIGVLIYGLVMAVLAGKRAATGEMYQYPGNIRLIK